MIFSTRNSHYWLVIILTLTIVLPTRSSSSGIRGGTSIREGPPTSNERWNPPHSRRRRRLLDIWTFWFTFGPEYHCPPSNGYLSNIPRSTQCDTSNNNDNSQSTTRYDEDATNKSSSKSVGGFFHNAFLWCQNRVTNIDSVNIFSYTMLVIAAVAASIAILAIRMGQPDEQLPRGIHHQGLKASVVRRLNHLDQYAKEAHNLPN